MATAVVPQRQGGRMSTPRYKPLDDATRAKCVALLRAAIDLAAGQDMLMAELSVQTVITVLETKEEQ